MKKKFSPRVYDDPPLARLLFASTNSAFLWFLIRIYVGWQWLQAGWDKVQSPAWIGSEAGTALTGFIQGAFQKTSGLHPDVQAWYAAFLQNAVLGNVEAWSFAIAWGQVLVGLGLIVGLFTGIAAFFGLFMNLNFLLAGTVSTNPILFVLGIGLMLAWKVAGYIGLDYFVLPALGTPWKGDRTGTLFKKSKK